MYVYRNFWTVFLYVSPWDTVMEIYVTAQSANTFENGNLKKKMTEAAR